MIAVKVEPDKRRHRSARLCGQIHQHVHVSRHPVALKYQPQLLPPRESVQRQLLPHLLDSHHHLTGRRPSIHLVRKQSEQLGPASGLPDLHVVDLHAIKPGQHVGQRIGRHLGFVVIESRLAHLRALRGHRPTQPSNLHEDRGKQPPVTSFHGANACPGRPATASGEHFSRDSLTSVALPP